MKTAKYVLLLFSLISCVSGKNYYINNTTNQTIDFEVHYINDSKNRRKTRSVPDSLRVVMYNGLAYKPYKFYGKSSQWIPYQKINDSLYRFKLKSKQKTIIPYRYYYDNSLKKLLINQEGEIWFTEFEQGNDTLIGYTTTNTKPSSTVHYIEKKFFGDDVYIIQLW